MKVVIVKTGNSETMISDQVKDVISLGDILRCTPLISHFNGHEVYWLTSDKATSLLRSIPNLQKVVTQDSSTLQLLNEADIIINLEQNLSIMKEVDHGRVLGFSPNKPELLHTTKGDIFLRDLRKELVLSNQTTLQHFIFRIIGEPFTSQPYQLSPSLLKETSSAEFNVGLNWKVGQKWPTKLVSQKYWKEIELGLLNSGHTVSWQKGFTDLAEYVDWLNSNQLIITNDSLGLHLALALNKRVICFFGPTSEKEVYTYDLMTPFPFNPPIDYTCLPCYSPNCEMPECCTNFIDVEEVIKTSQKILSL